MHRKWPMADRSTACAMTFNMTKLSLGKKVAETIFANNRHWHWRKFLLTWYIHVGFKILDKFA
jgi:hypothetical protein